MPAIPANAIRATPGTQLAAPLASCGGGAANVDVGDVAEQEIIVLGRVLVYYQQYYNVLRGTMARVPMGK